MCDRENFGDDDRDHGDGENFVDAGVVVVIMFLFVLLCDFFSPGYFRRFFLVPANR